MAMRTFDLGIMQVNGKGDRLAASLAIAFGFSRQDGFNFGDEKERFQMAMRTFNVLASQ
jgi:hypothetical protein